MTSCYAIRADKCYATGPEFINGSTIPELLDELSRAMREHPDLVHEANAVYEFTIYEYGTVTVDTTVPGGRVIEGRAANPDCTVSMSEATLKALLDRSLSPEWAIVTRRLRVSNYAVAMRLARILERVMR